MSTAGRGDDGKRRGEAVLPPGDEGKRRGEVVLLPGDEGKCREAALPPGRLPGSGLPRTGGSTRPPYRKAYGSYAHDHPTVLRTMWLPEDSRSMRMTFCSSPCFTDRYSCLGWKRSFFRLPGGGGGEGGLFRHERHPQHLFFWPCADRHPGTAPTHLSDSWMTKAFSRASRPGPGGRPTAERQPPLGRVSEGPELSMVSVRGSQGGRRGSPCPRIRALWEKVLRSGGRADGMGDEAGGRGREANTWVGRYLPALGHPVPGAAGQELQCRLEGFPHRPGEWSLPGPLKHPLHSGGRRPSR